MSIPAISSATGASVGTVHGTLSKLKASDTPAPIVGTDGKTYTPTPAQPLLSRFGGKNDCIRLYTGGQRLLIGLLLPPSLIHS